MSVHSNSLRTMGLAGRLGGGSGVLSFELARMASLPKHIEPRPLKTSTIIEGWGIPFPDYTGGILDSTGMDIRHMEVSLEHLPDSIRP